MRYFTHEIDTETYYCLGCGQHLSALQRGLRWLRLAPEPCNDSALAISHLVRRRDDRESH